MAYVPKPATVKIYASAGITYLGQWFDPVKNTYVPAKISYENGVLEATTTTEGDRVLVLKKN
jgi:hypothetical protein